MSLKDCCFMGTGKVYARKYEAVTNTENFVFLGNMSKFELTIDSEEKSALDYTNPAGGKDCSLTRINAIKLGLTFKCFDRKNLALGLFGTKTTIAAGSVVNYTGANLTKVITKDSLIPLKFKGPYTGVVVSEPSGPTTFVAGTDYQVTSNGIYIPATSTIPANTVLEIDYSYPAQDSVEFLTSASGLYEIFVDGINAADGVPFNSWLYRAKAGPANNINLISDDFASFDVTLELLKDDNRPSGTGLSQYGVLK